MNIFAEQTEIKLFSEGVAPKNGFQEFDRRRSSLIGCKCSRLLPSIDILISGTLCWVALISGGSTMIGMDIESTQSAIISDE